MKSYFQTRQEEAILLIKEAKVKNGLTNETLAKKIGMNPGTLKNIARHPEKMDLSYFWAIERLAGVGGIRNV